MNNKSEKLKLLKHIVIYITIGIVVFSVTFLTNNYVNIMLFDNKIDLRYAGVIFLVSMIAYTLPSLSKINRTMENKT